MELRPDLLLPAAALAIALLAGLLLYGLPLGQALCWALAFGALLPLRFSVNGLTGRCVSSLTLLPGTRLCFISSVR